MHPGRVTLTIADRICYASYMMKSYASGSLSLVMMTEFADQTGLSPPGKAPRRYLWTDAFAVCTFLDLYRQTGDEKYQDIAVRLVDQVHNTLGRHRKDDSRTGWISGLSEEEGKIHPTKGGLRIGKKMNERRPGDPYVERLEWDRDGQYYHYLTKWMHALNRMSRVIEDPMYTMLAIELAKTAHAGFTYVPVFGGPKRMYWKMSIDLTRPLVESMGHHDPLDGYITYTQLQATAANGPKGSASPDLAAEIAEMANICEGRNWTTDDPLGLGGVLGAACRVTQLIIHERFERIDLLDILLGSCLAGLRSYADNNSLSLPAGYRLAFRELGLSIGLQAVDKIRGLIAKHPDAFTGKYPLHSRIEALGEFSPLIREIESFWLEPANRQANSWMAHHDINMVMLATSLSPDGYLTI